MAPRLKPSPLLLCLASTLTMTPFCPGQTAGQTTGPEKPAQDRPRTTPPDYSGVHTQIPGVFVTPVPGQPFSAKVDIFSSVVLPSGQTEVRTTINRIARDSSGRIHNERRRLVPQDFKGEPILTETHIYDPVTHLNIWMNPSTHVAREIVLRRAPATPAADLPPHVALSPANPQLAEEDLGTQTLNGLSLHGVRKSRTIAADQSGTGKPIAVIDEYWYSAELSIYMLVKHNDPLTGEQIVAVSEVDRREPDGSLFSVPANFKIADETPVQ